MSEQKKWTSRDGTPLECDPQDPEDVSRWLLRNLDRVEDDIEDAGKLSGRPGLHAFADLTRAEAAALRDRMETEWKRATGGDPLPAEAAAMIDRYMAEEQGRAEKVDTQALAATDMEQAGGKSGIEGIRKGREVSARNRAAAAQSRRPDIAQIIQRLAVRPGTSGDLWPALRAELEGELMDPEETATAAGDLQYQFRDQHDRPQTISTRRFATRLSEARKSQ